MTTNEELDLKSDMCRNMGVRIFFAERALRSIALNHAEAARSGVTEALNALNGILPNSAPPAEPSGNNGELPVCATCGGVGAVQTSDTSAVNCKTCKGTGMVVLQMAIGYRHNICPDCSAAQPATEQPRIWRVRDSQGVLHLRVFSSERTARRWANVAGGAVVYSIDNGKTWIDEQAEREGK